MNAKLHLVYRMVGGRYSAPLANTYHLQLTRRWGKKVANLTVREWIWSVTQKIQRGGLLVLDQDKAL